MATVTDRQVSAALIAYDNCMPVSRVAPALTARYTAMRGALEAADAVRALEAKLPPVRCQAVQHSDEMACGRCGLRWDVNDPSPPVCNPTERRVSLRRRKGDR